LPSSDRPPRANRLSVAGSGTVTSIDMFAGKSPSLRQADTPCFMFYGLTRLPGKTSCQ
jgi:hypothetical protein